MGKTMLNEGTMHVRVGKRGRVNVEKFTPGQNAIMVQGMPYKSTRCSEWKKFLRGMGRSCKRSKIKTINKGYMRRKGCHWLCWKE